MNRSKLAIFFCQIIFLIKPLRLENCTFVFLISFSQAPISSIMSSFKRALDFPPLWFQFIVTILRLHTKMPPVASVMSNPVHVKEQCMFYSNWNFNFFPQTKPIRKVNFALRGSVVWKHCFAPTYRTCFLGMCLVVDTQCPTFRKHLHLESSAVTVLKLFISFE